MISWFEKSPAERVIALQDRNRHNVPPYAYGIVKIFILCSLIDGNFIPNQETTDWVTQFE